MRFARNFATALSLGAAVVLAVSGCSSSGGGAVSGGGTSPSGEAPSTGSASAGSSSPSAAAGDPIKVGFICSCTGAMGAANVSARNVTVAWSKHVNDNGGLGGHPIELVLQDSQSQPATALSAAQALVAAKVVAIIDGDILDAAWAKVATQAKIPVIGGNLASDEYSTNPDFYPSGQTNDTSIRSGIDIAAKQSGVTKLAYLYCSESPSCATNVETFKEQTAKDGIQLAYTASIAGNAPNYAAQCLAAKQAGVDGFWVGHGSAVAVRVIEDCAKQDFTPTIITIGTGIGPEMLKSAVASKNMWASFANAAFITDAEPVQKMNEVLDKYDPGFRQKDIFNQFSAQFWGAGLLLETAAKNAGITGDTNVTADVIRSGLDKVKDETLGGWSPELTFEPGKTHRISCYYTVHIKDGKSELVGDQSCVE